MLRSETSGDGERMAAALAGLAAYQAATRTAPPAEPPVAAAVGRARLLDYGGAGAPLVVVPSLINPHTILDLTEEVSLMRWLASRGVRPLLLDWGMPTPHDRGLDVAGHVEAMLLPLIDALGEAPLLAGYCLGGTMALAAAALRPVRGLALIATPWRFHGFPARTRAGIAELWEAARPPAEAMGVLPMEVLQAGFWRIDPQGTIDKYVRFGRMAPGSEAARRFVAMEDWANDGAPLTHAAGRELMEDLIAADRSGRRRWRVAGTPIVPGRITAPMLNIVSTTDRIVPAATAVRRGRRLTLGLGHVGMIVSRRARPTLWEPLAAWLLQQTMPR
ncbi:alpha/beta fold hydrolase [Sphingomonas quercus]|uniref:Alpha/beta fold hydrolase n=1 Tax=Sphingomonas quercus TaxID=2842451 RepID=A0ABS6BN18_9SPHN|nr:alpha/beta fold hydrolase [Sphingomonas quercus]MBU3079257.1 alpha/beta fold hydrolase [Sphingomonas quercus]